MSLELRIVLDAEHVVFGAKCASVRTRFDAFTLSRSLGSTTNALTFDSHLQEKMTVASVTFNSLRSVLVSTAKR